ncbi:hypothetical protein [Brevibacillus sp. NRS-1366]|uniref:hypothetical protein n=1 Tax=Brevibacillus sp. NRS-1366 TaxID=3233899 RepID=UPI003D20CABA
MRTKVNQKGVTSLQTSILFSILLAAYLTVGYRLGVKFFREIEHEEIEVYTRKRAKELELLQRYKKAALAFYILFGVCIYALFFAREFFSKIQKLFSTTSREWMISADLVSYADKNDLIKSELQQSLVGCEIAKISGDTESFDEDDLIKINQPLEQSFKIDTISWKVIEYEYTNDENNPEDITIGKGSRSKNKRNLDDSGRKNGKDFDSSFLGYGIYQMCF